MEHIQIAQVAMFDFSEVAALLRPTFTLYSLKPNLNIPSRCFTNTRPLIQAAISPYTFISFTTFTSSSFT